MILFEDENIFVLNKPSGISSCPLSAEETNTAVQLALAHCPNIAGIGHKPLEPGLLHRLDQGTSGALVFTKTQKEFERLKQAWKKNLVQKHYRAIAPIHEEIKNNKTKLPLQIDYQLGHDKKSSKRMKALIPPLTAQQFEKRIRGKSLRARTIIHKMLSLDSVSHPQYCDYWLEIQTGVMHQIRCHFAALQLPLLGDTLYKGKASSRLWLHAWKIHLPQKDGTFIQVKAPLPEGWGNP